MFFFLVLALTGSAQTPGKGQVNWAEGYISAVGEGTATPSGNRAKDQLRATRAATVLAQRALLETIKELKIDSRTKVENRMTGADAINTRVEGTIQGAAITKQDVRWEGATPIATVEMRVCLDGMGNCKSEKSIVTALALEQKHESPHAPLQRLDDISPKQERAAPGITDIIYNSGKPVTGVIFNLQGLMFERVILPVVITMDDTRKAFTVYSVKSVDPSVIRTYGVVRYADSVQQARENPYLGNNVMIIPVSSITSENMIVISLGAARLIRESTSHANDYMKSAKVVISAK